MPALLVVLLRRIFYCSKQKTERRLRSESLIRVFTRHRNMRTSCSPSVLWLLYRQTADSRSEWWMTPAGLFDVSLCSASPPPSSVWISRSGFQTGHICARPGVTTWTPSASPPRRCHPHPSQTRREVFSGLISRRDARPPALFRTRPSSGRQKHNVWEWGSQSED